MPNLSAKGEKSDSSPLSHTGCFFITRPIESTFFLFVWFYFSNIKTKIRSENHRTNHWLIIFLTPRFVA